MRRPSFLLAALMVATAVAPAGAQSVPDGQSCGGLLCDIGVLGHKEAPAAPAGTPVPAPVSTPVPPPEAMPRAPRAATVAKPRRHLAVRRAPSPAPRVAAAAAAPAPAPVRAPPPAARPPAPPPVAAAAPRRVFMFQSIDPQLY